MSIKTTKHVSRAWAIARITMVDSLARSKNYRELDRHVNESNASLRSFVDSYKAIDVDYLDKWSNGMLDEQLDERFFRESIFDNYLVSDDEEFSERP